MKRLLVIVLLLVSSIGYAQVVGPVIDTISEVGVGMWNDAPMENPVSDTVYLLQVDTVTLWRTDTLTEVRTDTVYLIRTDTIIRREADTAAITALREKERFYREILSSSGVDKVKLEAERNHYIHLVDSLRGVARVAEIENVRKEEANKYLEERARAAESQIAAATNRKKKVRPIQGIAMRFFRTPKWEIRIDVPDGEIKKVIRNRNAGNIEFDYITGASVMLWDMTDYFNKDHSASLLPPEGKLKGHEIRRFDQKFNYDLGLYVGFGGSNLFKNFYVGPSFRFVDFFYLTVGVNIAEYEVLVGGYQNGDIIPASLSIDDLTAKSWLVKPFVSLSIDLDFLSYIKK